MFPDDNHEANEVTDKSILQATTSLPLEYRYATVISNTIISGACTFAEDQQRARFFSAVLANVADVRLETLDKRAPRCRSINSKSRRDGCVARRNFIELKFFLQKRTNPSKLRWCPHIKLVEFICPHDSNGESLNGFPLNFVLDNFTKIC